MLPGGDKIYLKGLAAICWSIWKSRNKAGFDKILIKHPCDILFQVSTFLSNWAGIQKGALQEIVKTSVEAMIKVAIKVLQPQGRCYKTYPRSSDSR